jgi:hypothetical protein
MEYVTEPVGSWLYGLAAQEPVVIMCDRTLAGAEHDSVPQGLGGRRLRCCLEASFWGDC